ncbi:MAG: putative transcriptional regulator [Kiritimatiellia bacterium]
MRDGWKAPPVALLQQLGVNMSDNNLEVVNLEGLVNALAQLMPVKAKQLAEHVGISHIVVRDTLVDLEQRGIVYRTGRTRGTRWSLG